MDYQYLEKMTDQTGIIQFAVLDEPDLKSGHTIDDNARALLVALEMEGEDRERLSSLYLKFLQSAQSPDGSWCNLKVDGKFLPDLDSDDSQGRAFLACCRAASSDLKELSGEAQKLLEKALKNITELKSLRSRAYVLLGLAHYRDFSGKVPDQMVEIVRNFCGSLVYSYDRTKAGGWYWFEELITYCNGILPQGLFAGYTLTGDRRVLTVARDSLAFISDYLFDPGYLSIVGNKGWWKKGGYIPRYDQQPVDACSMVMVLWEAYQSTGERQYLDLARLAQEWYTGKNINQTSLLCPRTQGCYDALTPGGVNLNQGAESLLSWLYSSQIMKRREEEIKE